MLFCYTELMKTVFVGLSGGVDSAVSAYLLKKQGYRVVGVFLKVWEPDFLPCTSGQDRLDAMRVAAHLEIPFLSYDFEEEYKKSVVDYFIEEYRSGRTPNPDVACNREIKFGAFWEQAKKEGADFIATGHYAQVREVRDSVRTDTYERTPSESSAYARVSEGRSNASVITSERTLDASSAYARNKDYKLLRGVDEAKDQSYFLWTLTQDDLSHTLFPVGELPKTEVRRIANEAGLPNATKRDSQGLCFLGHVDMREFLQHYIPVVPGHLKNTEGEVIGTHDGVQFYTLGERFPLGSGEKLYVVKKNIDANELILSPYVEEYGLSAVGNVKEMHWIRSDVQSSLLEAQIRYHGERIPVSVHGTELRFKKPVQVAPGQSIVLYNHETDECVGGGVLV